MALSMRMFRTVSWPGSMTSHAMATQIAEFFNYDVIPTE
jgi:hypothetical protein